MHNHAQDNDKRNAAFIEAGGIGAYGSVGYERIKSFNDGWNICARIGFSTLHFIDFNGKFNPDLIFPIGIGLLCGKTHQLEVGIANTFTGIVEFENTKTKRNWSSNGALILGYRFNAIRNPLFVKCFYSPLLIHYERINHWGGIGLGYRF